jgi:4'-phosphopantetheinyl transferase
MRKKQIYAPVPFHNLGLLPDEIHVWRIPLRHCDDPLSSELYGTLSIEEKERVAGFRFCDDRESFIVRRGILRYILGFYLSIEPKRVRFSYGKYGKPEIDNVFSRGALYFNLAHTHGCILYAFSKNREVGVDIEYIRDIPEMNRIVRQFFSKNEIGVFQHLPEFQRKEAFFTYWTRKEAFIKAMGDGFFYPLHRHTVSPAPGESNKLVEISMSGGKTSPWSIQQLEMTDRFKAAIAYRGRSCRLLKFDRQFSDLRRLLVLPVIKESFC